MTRNKNRKSLRDVDVESVDLKMGEDYAQSRIMLIRFL